MTRDEIHAALTDEAALVAVLYGEARGEPIEGQIAVAAVIRNRVKDAGTNYKQIILAPMQFSCFNVHDQGPNTIATYAVAQALIDGTADATPRMRQLRWIAAGILSGAVLDRALGARFYMTTDLYESRPPSWAKTMRVTTVVGHHTFLSAEAA